MATKPDANKAKQPDSRAVMQAILEDEPVLAQAAINAGAATRNADNSISVQSDNASLRAIGQAFTEFTATRDLWMNTLVNRIVYTIVTSKAYQNPYARFKRGMMDLGETVEEVFVNLIEPYRFSNDKAEREVHKRFKNDVRAAFHSMNVRVQYPLSVSRQQMQTAFLSWGNLDDFIAKQVEALYSSMNTDDFLLFKYMVARAMLDGRIGSRYIPDVSTGSAEDLNNAAVEMRDTSLLMEYNSVEYNSAGVYNNTPIADQTIILTTRFNAESSVKVLARAYNMDKADFLGKVIGIDSFAKNDWKRLKLIFTDPDTGEVDPNFKEFTPAEVALLQTVPALVVDDSIWMMWDNLLEMTDQPNQMGLWWNYWLTHFMTLSMSPFAQACAFSSEAKSVTGVTVDPSTATLSKGATMKLTANVATTGIISKAVEWSMTGGTVSDTYVSGDGVVHVGKLETADSLTVTATSIADGTKAGNCTITVSA